MNTFRDLPFYQQVKRLAFVLLFCLLASTKKRGRLYYFSKWVKDNGDGNLLTNYPLDNNSIVLDVGGYVGVFTDQLNNLYQPKIEILEPVKSFYSILQKKYKSRRNIRVHNFGLSGKTRTDYIAISGDGSSQFADSRRKEKVSLIDVKQVTKKYKKIDLVSVNVEGAEYEILGRLIDSGEIKKIKFLQVQFHDIMPNSKAKRNKLIKQLNKTHKKKFQYPFVWESFERKN